MSENRLLHALSLVQDRYIVESAPGQTPPKEHPWLKWAAIAACFCILVGALFINSSTLFRRYQRISFNDQTLSENIQHISENTIIVNEAKDAFPEQLPIYKISKRQINSQDFQQMEENLEIKEWYWNEYDGYSIQSLLASYVDSNRRYFDEINYSDEQLEALAWETFDKLPFLDPNEYEYVGITDTKTIWSYAEGERVKIATVSFRRILNGLHVIGNDICSFSFDGTGLQAIYISAFDYEQIGTMNVVPYQEAEAKIKAPDYLGFGETYEIGVADELRVTKTWLLWVNQYSDGCTILQPVYRFTGFASFDSGKETSFHSNIIAIPESYTYEKNEEK